MTLIECFDRTVLENIAGALLLRPEKLILVGDVEKTSAFLPLLSDLLRKHGITTDIRLCDTAGMSIAQLAKKLFWTVSQEEQCVIDLTGGEEPVIMAVGAMFSQLKNPQNVSVQKFNLRSAETTDCDGDGKVVKGSRAFLTVEELISLHGGTAQFASLPSGSCTLRDIQKLWEVVADAPKDWNDNLSYLAEFEKRSKSKEILEIPRSLVRKEIREFSKKEACVNTLLEQFSRKGIIHDTSSRDTIRYEYDSELYRYCAKKAGNTLEIKTLLEAQAIRENGKPYFDDCVMGVTIDWDGPSQPGKGNPPDTHNEVDVILTKGLCSLFVSCKNGYIEESELYKLHTVAEHFGGPYAKKMLIATDLDQKNPAADRAFIQRARDMDIHLVTNAAEMDRQEWQAAFRSAMR